MTVLPRLLAIPPILVALAIAAWLINRAPGPARLTEAPPGLAVRVAPVTARDIHPQARGWASVQPAAQWHAVAELRGQIVWRHPDLEAGMLIPAGTEVLRIDPADYELALAQGEADLAALTAERDQIDAEEANTRRVLALEQDRLALAEGDLARIGGLVAQGVNPQTRADEAERAVLQSRRAVTELRNTLDLMAPRRARLAAQQARTEASIARARRDLDHTRVAAPFDVRICEVTVERHQPVAIGQPLIQGDGVAQAEIVVQVPLGAFRRLLAADGPGTDALTAIGAGPAARLSATLHPLADPGQHWQARVSRVEGGLDPRARTVPVVVTVDAPYAGANPPARLPLVPNMQVAVTLTGAPMTQAVTIPEAALHGQTAYVLGAENRLELRPVTPAFRQDGLVVIDEGLAVGEVVVIDDIAPALPGMRLLPVAAGGSNAGDAGAPT